MKSFMYVACLVLLALAVASPAIAGRHFEFGGNGHRHHHLRQHLHSAKREGGHMGALDLGFRALCVPTTSQTLEDHEGRHPCSYDHPNGFRAVGAGYNLDDDVDTRRRELSILFLDYDKVYSNETCLWDIQITSLLVLDSKRALDKAAESVEPLDDFCCDLQAVFADVQHSLASKSFPNKDLKMFIEKAALKQWGNAADELKESDWCYDNKKRCDDNIVTVKSGCNSLYTVGA